MPIQFTSHNFREMPGHRMQKLSKVFFCPPTQRHMIISQAIEVHTYIYHPPGWNKIYNVLQALEVHEHVGPTPGTGFVLQKQKLNGIGATNRTRREIQALPLTIFCLLSGVLLIESGHFRKGQYM